MDQDEWITRIAAARDAAEKAQMVFEQTIRDAHADGMSASAIARQALGTRSRERVDGILGRTPADVKVNPPHTPVAVITGSAPKTAIRHELAARGWRITSEHQGALLARGGVPVVMARISDMKMQVGRVTAKYRDERLVLERAAEPRWADVSNYSDDAIDQLGRPGAFYTDPVKVAVAITRSL